MQNKTVYNQNIGFNMRQAVFAKGEGRNPTTNKWCIKTHKNGNDKRSKKEEDEEDREPLCLRVMCA